MDRCCNCTVDDLERFTFGLLHQIGDGCLCGAFGDMDFYVP
jgi:hypothetical protein